MIRKFVLLAAVMVVAACRSSTEALVVRVDSETAGENCEQGGVAIRSGYDANNSTTLDDSEVDASKTKYVCNGATGSVGQPGQNGEQGDAGVRGHDSLNKVTTEAAGTNCENGGSKIETGLDTNDNGTLEAGEVTATSYVCSQSSADDYFFGDITIRTDDDLAQLDGKRVVFGSIFIEHATGGVFTLPALEAVTGFIQLGDGDDEGGGEVGLRALTPVRELHFPKLVSANGIYVGSYDDLTVLDLPLLARVGEIRIGNLSAAQTGAPGLVSISLPVLVQAGVISLRDADALTTFSAPLLTSIEHLELEYNDVLVTVTVHATLTVIRELDVYGNAALSDCFAHRLLLNGEPAWGTDIDDNLSPSTCTAADFCRPVTVTGLTNFHQCGNSLPFAAAQTFCGTVATGGTLAWFESAAEWTAFSNAVADGVLSGDAWIGYSDEATANTWVASGGTSTYNPTTDTTISFWAPGEPNDTTHTENAAQIYWSGRANDGLATDSMRFYCRVP